METFRLSSKLREHDREYLIQTANDIPREAVSTTIFVDGVRIQETCRPHPAGIAREQLLALVKKSHGEKKQELENLLQTWERAVADGDPVLLYRLAEAFNSRSLFWEASQLLQVLVRIDPENHRAFHHLGLNLRALGRAEDAVAAAGEAVRFQPRFADYRNNLGEAYLALGECEPAMSEFQEAISINLYYADAYFNLAVTYALAATRVTDHEQIEANVSQTKAMMHKAGLIQDEYQSHRSFEDSITALNGRDFTRSLSLLKGIRESVRALRRRELAILYTSFIFDSNLLTDDSVASQIESLEAEKRRHPSYLDIQTELARCYLEQARLVWVKGIHEFEEVIERQPSLATAAQAVEEAEVARKVMTKVLADIHAAK